MRDDDDEAVLVTGWYGTGKTSAVEEMADRLERSGVRFAAIDLDWLAWANVEDGHGPAGRRLLLANLAAVVANDRAAGMTRFLLAGTFSTEADVDGLRRVLEMPLRVVRLVAPIGVIERRLGRSPTRGRGEDLAQARRDAAGNSGAGIGELEVDADRPLADVADEILAWLEWEPATP
jgi:hypothetical protein